MESEKTLKFNDAMSLTGFGRYNIVMTFLSGLISMAYVLETIGFSFILPAAECDLKLSLTHKGWVAAIPFIGLISSSQFWGYMADTRGRRKILIISMTLGAICSTMSSLSYNLQIFAVLKFCTSVMISASNVIVFPYYGEFTPKAYVDRMLAVISSVIIFSASFTTLIAWGVLSLDFHVPIDFLGIIFRPWRLMIICFSLPVVLATFCLTFAPESPKYLLNHGRDEEALSILRRMYEVNTRNNPAKFAVKTVILDDLDHLDIKNKRKSPFKSLWNQTAPLFKMPHLKYVLIIMILNFGVYGSTTPYIIWLPDIIERFYIGLDSENSSNKKFCELMHVRTELADEIGRSARGTCNDFVPVSTYHMMLAVTTTMGICNVILAICMKWFQKKIVFLVMLGVGGVSTLSIQWIRNPWVSWTCLVVFQCCGILRGVLLAYAVELFPTNFRVTAMSLFLIFGRLGVITGTNIIGYLMEVNCQANFIAYGLVLLVCIILCLLLPGKTKSAPTVLEGRQEARDATS